MCTFRWERERKRKKDRDRNKQLQLAVNTLLKHSENTKDTMVLILDGYSEQFVHVWRRKKVIKNRLMTALDLNKGPKHII